MPTPNQRETEKRKDKKAAASMSQSALVNTFICLHYCNLFVVYQVDEVVGWLDSPKSNVFNQRDNQTKRGREQLAGVVEIHRVCGLFTLTITETSGLPPVKTTFVRALFISIGK
jgi:hypothetical protein